MTITKPVVANQIAAYLHHEITLAQLVDWSERALMDGEFAESDAATLAQVVSRLGVADVRAFGPGVGRLRRDSPQARFCPARGRGCSLILYSVCH